MKKIFLLSIVTVSFLWFISCNDNGETENICTYGEPTPILSAEIEGVSDYTFSAKDSSGMETAFLTDTFLLTGNIRFTLIQSGCKNVKQEFRFELPNADYSMQADSFFVQRVAESLKVLSEKSISTSQSFIPDFAFELYTNAARVTLNQEFEVDQKTAPGVFFKINKIVSTNEAMISLAFLNR
jgi:hypothetical protein